MALYKSVLDAKTGVITQEPVDAAARREVLDVQVHEGKISQEDYKKQVASLESTIEKQKGVEVAEEKARADKQSEEREAALKVNADRHSKATAESAALASEKAQRKTGKEVEHKKTKKGE